jgi:glycosyltransferase involved in cell wall biosynthesis
LFLEADVLTVPDQSMKDLLVKCHCPENKIIVHHSGIDLNKFKFRFRTPPGPGEPLVMLCVGRLVEKKGIQYLIRAFSQVIHHFPDIRLRIIGDGPLKAVLAQLIRRLGLTHAVTLTGAKTHDDVAKEMDRAHLFCLPSITDRHGNREGIPNVLKEAMACGLPVISTYHGGIPELVEDGVNGYLVPEKDEEHLTAALIKAIETPETWAKLAESARNTVERSFDVKKQIDELEVIYDTVTKKHRRKRPFFSVIIPAYNRERYIGKAIESVLAQTCRDFELIVVDDGSTDNTAKEVKRYGDRVCYIYQKNRGPSAARNTGIKAARGKYIAFLDSDDRFFPDKLRRNKKYLKRHPKCKFLYSWYTEVDGDGNKLGVKKPRHCRSRKEIQKQLYRRNFTIRTSSVVVKRTCFKRVGLFDENYLKSQDWDMWLRLVAKYRGYCQKAPLVEYRRHDDSITGRYKISPYHPFIRRKARMLFGWGKRRTFKRTKRVIKTVLRAGAGVKRRRKVAVFRRRAA